MDPDGMEAGQSGGLADRLPPQVLAGLGAIGRVARALVGMGDLSEVAERAFVHMRDELGFELVALYLPAPDGRPALELHVISADDAARSHPRDHLAFDDEAWRLAVTGGSPLVFHESASWLIDHPFAPAARSWLVLPLSSQEGLAGVVIAASPEPISLDPTLATVLTLLGDLLSAGIATATLRQEVQRAEIERERMRLAADVHDGLAQDLGVAKRELALLESEPLAHTAQASRERLREAVLSAHRVVRSRLEDLSVSVPLGGIGPAVEQMCARFRRGGLPVTHSTPGRTVDASPEAAAVVLRVLNESLTNAARHASPTAVTVDLSASDDRLELAVEDDGRGFTVDEAPGPGEGHFGITLMHERARSSGGSVAVTSGRDGGTRVTLRLPLA